MANEPARVHAIAKPDFDELKSVVQNVHRLGVGLIKNLADARELLIKTVPAEGADSTTRIKVGLRGGEEFGNWGEFASQFFGPLKLDQGTKMFLAAELSEAKVSRAATAKALGISESTVARMRRQARALTEPPGDEGVSDDTGDSGRPQVKAKPTGTPAAIGREMLALVGEDNLSRLLEKHPSEVRKALARTWENMEITEREEKAGDQLLDATIRERLDDEYDGEPLFRTIADRATKRQIEMLIECFEMVVAEEFDEEEE